MASTPPRCLRETAPAFLFLHLLSFLDPSQHNRALQCLSVSAVMACVNTLYTNKKRVRVWFRFTRGPFLGSNPESAALQRRLNDRPNIRLRGVAENFGPQWGDAEYHVMMWPQLRRRELKVDRKLNLGVGVDVKNRASESTTERVCAKLVFLFILFFLVPHSSAATCNNHSSFIAWWWMGHANNMGTDNEKQMVISGKKKKKKALSVTSIRSCCNWAAQFPSQTRPSCLLPEDWLLPAHVI